MALVLSRKRNEQIVATTKSGEQIVITVVELRGDKCRLAFDADDTTRINRREVQNVIDSQNQQPPRRAA